MEPMSPRKKKTSPEIQNNLENIVCLIFSHRLFTQDLLQNIGKKDLKKLYRYLKSQTNYFLQAFEDLSMDLLDREEAELEREEFLSLYKEVRKECKKRFHTKQRIARVGLNSHILH